MSPSLTIVRFFLFLAVGLAHGSATGGAEGASPGAYPPESTLRPGKIKRGPDGQIILEPNERDSRSTATGLSDDSSAPPNATRTSNQLEISEAFVHPGHGHLIVVHGRGFGARGTNSVVWLADAPQWQRVSVSVTQTIVSWSDDAIKIVVDYGPLTRHGEHGQFRLHELEKNLPDVWIFVRDEGGDRETRSTRFVTPVDLDERDGPAQPRSVD